ncbi:DUF6233 domain-containing protein [Actinacidiphila glaucinigra]|uniref:DUF6233 domain-containing protein n=1 Tax=Actinacidiphila glaucinigra TaxID=235986 RepID=UPI0033BE2615
MGQGDPAAVQPHLSVAVRAVGDAPRVAGEALAVDHDLVLPAAAVRGPRLHRADCWIDNGENLTTAEASVDAARPDVEPCRLCRPSPLRPCKAKYLSGGA